MKKHYEPLWEHSYEMEYSRELYYTPEPMEYWEYCKLAVGDIK